MEGEKDKIKMLSPEELQGIFQITPDQQKIVLDSEKKNADPEVYLFIYLFIWTSKNDSFK